MLLGTRMTGRPSLLEQQQAAEKRRKAEATQVLDGPAERDHTRSSADGPTDGHQHMHQDHVADDEGFDDAAADADAPHAPDRHQVKSAGRLENAIARHMADAPSANRAGRELVGRPTSPAAAPTNPTGGTAAPGAPVLSDARDAGSGSPDTLSSHAEAAREGANRAQTRAPAGLDFQSSGSGVQAAGRNPDGSFVAAHDVAVAKLDLTRQGTPAAHFARPNAALPGHAMNGPTTGQPNASTNERNG